MLQLCPKHGANPAPFCQWCRSIAHRFEPGCVSLPERVLVVSAPAVVREKLAPTAHEPRYSDWTDDRIAALKKLWAEGLSARCIAGRLGGITRSAVIGKVHRLGLPGRATQHRFNAGSKRPHKPRRHHDPRSFKFASQRPSAAVFVAEPYAPPPKPNIPESERKTLLQLEDGDCRFPVTDGPPHQFCARAKVAGLPYCADHARIAYAPPQPRAERPRSPSFFYPKSVLTGQLHGSIRTGVIEEVG